MSSPSAELASAAVAVDASFALKLVLPEEHSDRVRQLWEGWVNEGVEILAPYLLAYEATSVLRHKVFREELTPQEAEAALEALQAQEIALRHPEGLERTAWGLARRFNRPTAYDTSYVALAQLVGCELWTADERLKNALRGELAYVKWVGEGP